MKLNRAFQAFWVALTLSASLSAGAGELPPVLDSVAGQYVLRELGLGGGEALTSELESRLVADLERVRARLEPEGSTGDLFAPGARALSEAEAQSLRGAFVEQGRDVRDFLGLGERPGGFEANRDRFTRPAPLPHGAEIHFVSRRPDLVAGTVYRIEIPMSNARLDRYVDRFEQGTVADFLRRFPKELEAVGVRIVERLPNSTLIEVPDIEALNARVKLRGGRWQFELAASEEALPIQPYLEGVVRGRIPIAPVGANSRMFTHDLLVHAIAIAAFLPSEAAAAFSDESAALLRVYARPEVQGSATVRAFVKAVMRTEVARFDQQTALIMAVAGGDSGSRVARLLEIFNNIGGGSVRALALLSVPESSLSAAEQNQLSNVVREEIPRPTSAPNDALESAARRIDARLGR